MIVLMSHQSFCRARFESGYIVPSLSGTSRCYILLSGAFIARQSRKKIDVIMGKYESIFLIKRDKETSVTFAHENLPGNYTI